MEEDYMFEQEVGAYDRAHHGIDQYLSEVNIDSKQTRAKSPEDRFIININAIANGLGIDEKDKTNIFEMVESQKINNIAFRNPTAFVLGYLASRNGSNVISKSRVQQIFDKLGNLEDRSIKPPDVIRYMRFWISLNGSLNNVQIVD